MTPCVQVHSDVFRHHDLSQIKSTLYISIKTRIIIFVSLAFIYLTCTVSPHKTGFLFPFFGSLLVIRSLGICCSLLIKLKGLEFLVFRLLMNRQNISTKRYIFTPLDFMYDFCLLIAANSSFSVVCYCNYYPPGERGTTY